MARDTHFSATSVGSAEQRKPFKVSSPKYPRRISAQDFLRDVIYVLQGIDGRYIKYNKALDAFTIEVRRIFLKLWTRMYILFPSVHSVHFFDLSYCSLLPTGRCARPGKKAVEPGLRGGMAVPPHPQLSQGGHIAPRLRPRRAELLRRFTNRAHPLLPPDCDSRVRNTRKGHPDCNGSGTALQTHP